MYDIVDPSCALSIHVGTTICFMVLSCVSLCRLSPSSLICQRGLGKGASFSWLGDISERLPEEVEPGAIFPLRGMDTNILRQHPGPTDATVCGLHQSYGNPTPDVSPRPGVGLPHLCFKVAG